MEVVHFYQTPSVFAKSFSFNSEGWEDHVKNIARTCFNTKPFPKMTYHLGVEYNDENTAVDFFECNNANVINVKELVDVKRIFAFVKVKLAVRKFGLDIGSDKGNTLLGVVEYSSYGGIH